MEDSQVETGVDQLVHLLRDKKKISMEDAAKELKMALPTIQLWVDFLVEEKIVGVEYKFTKPFLYLNEAAAPKEVEEEKTVTIETYRKQYMASAKDKKIPENEMHDLWVRHLTTEVDKQKEFFLLQARKRGIENGEDAWRNYRARMVKN